MRLFRAIFRRYLGGALEGFRGINYYCSYPNKKNTYPNPTRQSITPPLRLSLAPKFPGADLVEATCVSTEIPRRGFAPKLRQSYCVLLCTTVYACVRLCTTVYYCVLPCTAVYYSVLLCTTVYCRVLLCTTHCVPARETTSRQGPLTC